jgi:hypothetical protein
MGKREMNRCGEQQDIEVGRRADLASNESED